MVSGPGPLYPDGSITKVIYNNFLTYGSAVLTPGPNLNLIIGANGTGKSTVICGLCLAVGGNPKVLGRSEKMTDYIKHGCDSGSVELHIEDSVRGTQKLGIKISKPNSCEYVLNGKKTTQKNIREIVAGYNIQIDNPCTFLAQDKVKSFSEQNPVELLHNTEKADNPLMLEQHLKLIEKKKDGVDMETQAKQTEQRLRAVRNELDILLPRVENFRKMQSVETKLKALKQRHALLVHQTVRQKVKDVNSQLEGLRNEVAEADKKLRDAEKQQQLERMNKNRISQMKEELERDVRMTHNQLTHQVNPDYYRETISEAEQSYANARRAYETYETRVAELEETVKGMKEKYENAVAAAEGIEAFQTKYQDKNNQLNEEEDAVQAKERALDQQKNGLSRSYRELNDAKAKQGGVMAERVRCLRQSAAGRADDAWKWYEEHRDQFEHPLYVPLLHMTMVTGNSAKYLENLVSARDLVMFICGSKHDELLLTRDKPWKINTTVVNGNSMQQHMLNARLPAPLKQYGFECWAIELFSAPDPVKQYLCSVNALHMCPIGTSRTSAMEEQVMKVMRDHQIGVYLTDARRCSIKVSKYSGETLRQAAALRDPRQLVAHSRPLPQAGQFEQQKAELDQKAAEFRAENEEIQRQRQEIGQRREALRQEQATWRAKKQLVFTVKQQLTMNTENLRTMRGEKPNVDSAKAALEECRSLALKETLKRVQNITKKVADAAAKEVRMSLLTLVHSNLTAAEYASEGQLRDIRQAAIDLKAHLQVQEDSVRHVKVEMDAARAAVKELCNVRTTKEDKMSSDEKKQWERMWKNFTDLGIPKKVEDVERLLVEEETKRSLGSKDGSQQDVEKSEALKIEEVDLVQRCANQRDCHEKWAENLQKEIDEWRGPVEELVSNININYKAFFKELGRGCTGEVHLEVPKNALEIGSYGIMIMVSFRENEELKRLDHQVQSGGERSVSTMLYLLSLQELCKVPFRCVDEINQGMDPTNERRVFDIMVKKLTGDGNLAKTQYFLLTPKLLHDLKYNEKVTVQIVHNGPTLSNSAHKWEPNDFLALMKQQSVTA